MLAGMAERYSVRRDASGFSVFDLWTGETVVIAMTSQDGLSQEDAEHTAAMLNRRADGGDRSVLQ
jgi:hypothetical protein